MKLTKRILTCFLIGICLALFVVLAVLQTVKQEIKMDTWAINLASNLDGGVISFFKIYTHIGSFFALIIIALSMLFFKNKKIGITACVTLLFASLFNVVVKYIIRRPRPAVTHLEEVGYSFPSAHAMLTCVVLGFLVFIVIKYVNSVTLKSIISSLLIITILAVGFSRVILGVHYLTDVLAGFIIAIPILISSISVFNCIDKQKTNKRTM